MKHTLLVTLLLLSLDALAASPVWLVQAGSNRLFIAGTVHILRGSDYPLPAAFDKAYAASRHLVFEIDIDDTLTPSFRQLMANSIKLPAGTRVEEVLKTRTLNRLNSYLHSHNLPIEKFAQLKPGMIATTLTLMELKRLGVNSKGVDAYFHEKARDDEKRVSALESVEDQLRFFTAMDRYDQDLLILHTLEELATLERDFDVMLSAWREGDTSLIKSLFVDPMQQDFNPIYQELLVLRNREWLGQLVDHLHTPATEMVLVGSAHLVGEDGLLHMLKEKGLTVTQLD